MIDAAARDIVIRTMLGEAMGEGPDGLAAVAHVILNRSKDPRWPSSPASVALQNKQFSAWNKGAGGNDIVRKYGPGTPQYEMAAKVLDQVISGDIKDMTHGATHYYSPAGMAKLVSDGDQANSVPKWLKQEEERSGGAIRIGGHIFVGRSEGTDPVDWQTLPDSVPDYQGGGVQHIQVTPEQQAQLYEAYVSGQMNPQQRADYESDIRAGAMSIPDGVSLYKPLEMSPEDSATLYQAYVENRMTPEQVQDYEGDVRTGKVLLPQGVGLNGPVINPIRPTHRPGQQEGLSDPSLTPPPVSDFIGPPVAPEQKGAGFDIAADQAQRGLDLAKAAGSALVGGPSVATQMLPDGLPGRNVVGRVLDVPLAAAGLVDAGISGAAGAVGDVAEGLGVSRGTSQRLARDLASIPEAFAGSAVTPAARASGRVAQVAKETAPADMGVLIGKAALGSKKSQAQIAEMAKIDPAAFGASRKLGFDLPADVFATNASVQQATGVIRSVKGSESAVAWEEAFLRAQRQASKIMEQAGGGSDIGIVSENVKTALRQSIDDLRSKASPIYDDITNQMGPSTIIDVRPVKELLAERMANLGGKITLMDREERRIFKAVQDGEMTVEAVKTLRRGIGESLGKRKGIYANVDQKVLAELYGALTDVEERAVAAILGPEAATKMGEANALWRASKELEDKLIAGFGVDGQGSIAKTLQSAITSGSKGDIAGLNRVLEIVPDHLRREAVAVALDAVTKANTGAGGFSFTKFAKTYRGMRENAPVYMKIKNVLGPEASDLLAGLYKVSTGMERASRGVSTTGASNQALLQAALSESVIARMLNSTIGMRARTAAGATVGSVAVGPLGAAIGAAAGGGKVGRNRAQALSRLLESHRFQRLLIDAAKTGNPSKKAVRSVAFSPEFKRWARVTGIENPNEWLAGAFVAQEATEDASQ